MPYAKWLPPESRIVVIVDRDEDDCQKLKSKLEQICKKAGLQSKRVASGPDWQVVTRIGYRRVGGVVFWRLASSMLGLSSRFTEYSKTSKIPRPRRNQKRHLGGHFKRVLQRHGYFKQGLAKVEVANLVGQHIDPSRNSSRSFALFYNAIVESFA